MYVDDDQRNENPAMKIQLPLEFRSFAKEFEIPTGSDCPNTITDVERLTSSPASKTQVASILTYQKPMKLELWMK